MKWNKAQNEYYDTQASTKERTSSSRSIENKSMRVSELYQIKFPIRAALFALVASLILNMAIVKHTLQTLVHKCMSLLETLNLLTRSVYFKYINNALKYE